MVLFWNTATVYNLVYFFSLALSDGCLDFWQSVQVVRGASPKEEKHAEVSNVVPQAEGNSCQI